MVGLRVYVGSGDRSGVGVLVGVVEGVGMNVGDAVTCTGLGVTVSVEVTEGGCPQAVSKIPRRMR